MWCYQQCFELTEYIPDMQSQLLHFVIDKCLEMDVEIYILDGGEVALENGNSKDENVFMLEMDEAPPTARNLPAGNGATVIDTADKVRGHRFLFGFIYGKLF